MSSAIQTIKAFFGSEDGAETKTYRCSECGETHESAKRPERARCPECLSSDVQRVS